MAQRTPTQSDSPPVYYALFRKDSMTVDRSSALRDEVYLTYEDAQKALADLIPKIPLSLRKQIVIHPITDINYNPNSDPRWYVAIAAS